MLLTLFKHIYGWKQFTQFMSVSITLLDTNLSTDDLPTDTILDNP
jgi:hypothetical protein